MNKKDYWAKRSTERILSSEKLMARYEAQIKSYFREAEKNIESQIASLYQKYAKDNKVYYQEALHYLTNKQHKEFNKDLEFYIQCGKDREFRKEYREYLQALSTRARVKILEEYKARIEFYAENLYADVRDSSVELFGKTLNDTYLRTVFDIQQFDGFVTSFNALPDRTLKTLLEYPWSGSNFSAKIWSNVSNLSAKLDKVLTVGMIQGKSNQDMARDLVEATGKNVSSAIRLVRTESNYICNQATLKAYEEYGVNEYEYLATLDLRTSSICRELDGQVFSMDEQRPGINYPPMHPYCRSTTVPYFPDEDNQTRVARDENGRNIKVPASMKYEEWHKTVIVDRLGEKNASIYEKMIKNEASDKKLYKSYVKILGKEAPETFDIFRRMKYNNSEEWLAKKREYSTMNAINSKKWPQTFKDKVKSTYYDFKKDNIELTCHGAQRFVERHIDTKGRVAFTQNDIVNIFKKHPNYKQPDGRLVNFENGIAVIRNQDTNEVVSIVLRKTIKKEWIEL